MRVICDVARQKNFNEIIMGSRGNTGLQKVIRGNVSREVARKADCPVRIIK